MRTEYAQICLEQVDNSAFFKISVVKFPNYYMLTSEIDGATFLSKGDPCPQGYFNLTPHNEGEHFTVATQKWPDANLYIGKMLVHSKIGFTGPASHIGITYFDDEELDEMPGLLPV